MVRLVTHRRPAGWKAALAIVVAAGALLWHLLACVESPMAFSPDGKQLAFTVMLPYDGGDLDTAGTHLYRLMVLSGEKDFHVLEESATHMLTAPAWTPDGKHIVYLRIPLLDEAAKERIKELSDQAAEHVKKAEELIGQAVWPGGIPATQPAWAVIPDKTPDWARPDVAAAMALGVWTLGYPCVPAALVVREAATGKEISTTRVDLPLLYISSRDTTPAFAFAYILTSPQISPDGKWVFLCVGQNVLLAFDTQRGEAQVLAALALTARLSPDGTTLAYIVPGEAAFLRDRGRMEVRVRLEGGDGGVSPSGLAWVDKQTIALLGGDTVTLVRSDGTVARTLKLNLPEHGESSKEDTGTLAVSPDGKRMVVSYGTNVFFLTTDGKLVHHWTGQKEQLYQPTFSPDSKRVAVKALTTQPADDRPPGVTHIVFFTPEGKELSRAALPAIEPEKLRAILEAASRPASGPATVPTRPVRPAGTTDRDF